MDRYLSHEVYNHLPLLSIVRTTTPSHQAASVKLGSRRQSSSYERGKITPIYRSPPSYASQDPDKECGCGKVRSCPVTSLTTLVSFSQEDRPPAVILDRDGGIAPGVRLDGRAKSRLCYAMPYGLSGERMPCPCTYLVCYYRRQCFQGSPMTRNISPTMWMRAEEGRWMNR